MMIEQLDDVTPEEIGEELSDSPFEPRWVMYMYEHRRPDGRVSYPRSEWTNASLSRPFDPRQWRYCNPPCRQRRGLSSTLCWCQH